MFECGLKHSCRLALEGSVPESETEGSEITQSCPTPCDPMDCSLPGCSIHGIFPARVVEWVAISFSRGIFPTQGLNPGLPHCRQMFYLLSYQGSPQITILDHIGLPWWSESESVQLFVTPRLSPWNSPGKNTGVGNFSLLQENLPNSGIEPRSLALQTDSLPTELSGKLLLIGPPWIPKSEDVQVP